jgi:hypothetical protein
MHWQVKTTWRLKTRRPRGLHRDVPILFLVVAGLWLIVASLAACSPRPHAGPYQATFRDSFEAGLDDWHTEADVPQDGERPGPVAWSIEESELQSSAEQFGQSSLWSAKLTPMLSPPLATPASSTAVTWDPHAEQ